MFLCLCDDNCLWHDTCCMIIYLTMHYHLRDNLKGCITVFFGINWLYLRESYPNPIPFYVSLTVPSSDIHQYWAWSRSWSDHCWCLKWCKKGSTINKTLRKIECCCCVVNVLCNYEYLFLMIVFAYMIAKKQGWGNDCRELNWNKTKNK